MPNHFHCIIENVGADLRVRPNVATERNPNEPGVDGLGNGTVRLVDGTVGLGSGVGGLGEHTGSPLRRVIQWFKTMTTNEYIRNVKVNNWPRFNEKLWQRNYWEHIIRNKRSYKMIAEYIANNPCTWNTDSINPDNKNE